MQIQFRCPCNTAMTVSRTMVGQVVACPGCGQHLQVPAPAGQALLPQTIPPGSTHRQNPTSKPVPRNSNMLLIGGLATLFGLLVLGAIGAAIYLSMGASTAEDEVSALAARAEQRVKEQGVSGSARTEFEIPTRPRFRPAFLSGVQLATARFRDAGPAGSTQMKVYLPAGKHADGSLGCVLVAPAGTNLLMGNEPGGDYHDETLPYAEAGYAVIQYSLDGYADLERVNMTQVSRAYQDYRKAEAGTTNARAVIAFLKEELPEVDHQRIYVAGHSSAGTVALNNACLLSDDIAGCIAYAPCSDPVAFHEDLYGEPDALRLFPGMKEFDQKYSPVANAAMIQCPVFVFHAKGDRVVEFRESKVFTDKVSGLGKAQVTLSEVGGGDHYSPMIRTGIPRAIEWLKQLEQ